MTAVSTTMKRKNDQSFTRSARVPDTMEAVEPTKTIWKNQSDIAAWPRSVTAGAADASPARRARSASDGPWKRSSVPSHPPSSTLTYMRL